MAAPKAAWCKSIYLYAASRLNLDVELRYRAVARRLRVETRSGSEVLEVGAGAISISRYFDCRTVAVDPSFDESKVSTTGRIHGSAIALPFADGQWEVVCSIDMLEHIPPDARYKAVLEMLRVAKSLVVIAVPVGDASYRHDIETNEYHLRKNGTVPRFTAEHVEFGLPSEKQVKRWIEDAARELGRGVEITGIPNVNIRFRLWYMKLSWHPNLLIRGIYVALFPLAYVGRALDQGECYRQIFTVRLGKKIELAPPREDVDSSSTVRAQRTAAESQDAKYEGIAK